MNKDLKDIQPLIIAGMRWLKRYYGLVIFVFVSMVYGYLIIQINSFNRQQPDESSISNRIKQVKRPSIDKQTAEKLKSLEDNSQEVHSLFRDARENPFQE